MSKLFKLKEWLTLPDAAKYLTSVFEEEVTEADILRFVLDGHLTLSVNFVNHAYAKCGKIVEWMDTEWLMFGRLHPLSSISNDTLTPDKIKACPHALLTALNSVPENERANYRPLMMSLYIDDERYLTLSKTVKTISGVWDLPMIGGEKLDIEHAYQMMTGGPAVTLETLDGSFVESEDGEICQLQESFDQNECISGSLAELEKIKMRIAVESLTKTESDALLNKHKENRKIYIAHRNENKNSDFYPTGKLPDDSVFVIRTAALRAFEQSINDTPTITTKPLATLERNTLLIIIAALCDYSAINYQERGVAKQLANMTQEIGAAVSDDTIRKILAQIPDALESRTK